MQLRRSFLDLSKTGHLREENRDDFCEEIHKISCIKGSQNRRREGLEE